jgi:hypothetical protein
MLAPTTAIGIVRFRGLRMIELNDFLLPLLRQQQLPWVSQHRVMNFLTRTPVLLCTDFNRKLFKEC